MRKNCFKIIVLSFVFFSLLISASGYERQFSDASRANVLRWKNNVIHISVSKSFVADNHALRPGTDGLEALRNSLKSWEEIADIRFELTFTDKESISPAGKSGDRVNLISAAQTTENLYLFGGDSEQVASRTRVFFDSKGFITESDIILNPYEQFSTDGSIGTFDLEATLTHEIGHLLGLDHSDVIGATMQADQAKNGIYNLPGFISRTLAEDDITGIRSIYGANSDVSDCCEKIEGSITNIPSKSGEKYYVWLEDAGSGRVVAQTNVDTNGAFEIEGLSVGEYEVFVKSGDKSYSSQTLGNIKIEKGKTSEFETDLPEIKKNFEVNYLGFNGQLSKLPVFVNAGKSYVIYIGGKNLDPDKLNIRFSSPFISVSPNRSVLHDFGKEISAISFEISLSSEIPNGEYSITLSDQDHGNDYLIGGISVESFVNPWNSYLYMEIDQKNF